MIHHDPNKQKATYPESTPIDEVLGRPDRRKLIVETYSRKRALLSGKREYRWRVRHKSNGEILCSGEGYSDSRDRDHAVDVLWPDLGIDALG